MLMGKKVFTLQTQMRMLLHVGLAGYHCSLERTATFSRS